MYESLTCNPSLWTYIFLFVPLGSTFFYHKRECIILFCFVFCFKIQVLVLYIKQKENYTNFHQSLLKLHYHPIVSNHSHSCSLIWRLQEMIKKSYIFTFTFIFHAKLLRLIFSLSSFQYLFRIIMCLLVTQEFKMKIINFGNL